MHLPEPPIRPSADECCGGGCSPCVFDAYREAMAQHEALVGRIQAEFERLKGTGPPPGNVNPATSYGSTEYQSESSMTDMEDLCQFDEAPSRFLCTYMFRPFRLIAKRPYTRDSWELIGEVPLSSSQASESTSSAIDDRTIHGLGITAGQHVLMR
jgi:hypothetical protein